LKTKLVAVDTPEKLRESLWGRKTVIQLDQVSDAIVSAVKRVGPWNIEVVDSKLVIGVSNPEKENPDIVNAIGAVGGRVQFVTEVSPTLENVYLKLVRS
jgi:ABC-2 type transport system ATP-binding protein